MIEPKARSGEDLQPTPPSEKTEALCTVDSIHSNSKKPRSDLDGPDSFLIYPLTETAKNQIESLREEIKLRFRAEFQGTKEGKKWVGPLYDAIPAEEKDPFLAFLKETQIPINEVRLEPHRMKPKFLRKALGIDIDAQGDRRLATNLELEKREKQDELDRQFSMGDIDKSEHQERSHDLEELYDPRIRAAQDRADRNESAAMRIAVEGQKKLKPADAELDAIVDELNNTLAIVHTTQTYFIMEKENGDFVLDTKSSVAAYYENQPVPGLPPGETKFTVWRKSANRRTYKSIVFNPGNPGHYEGNFNIFKGFPIHAIQGDCSLFWDFVKTIICSRNEEHYLYVRKWMGHLIQKPCELMPGLILRGKQGIGKGTYANRIGELLGPYYSPLASLDQILGRFNSHLQRAILIFADEAIWGGHKKEVGVLKSLITERKRFIEPKGKDGYHVDNCAHLIASSNEDWVVHLDPDDRRFFVLDIPSEKKEDREYFGAIDGQIKNGGREALMYDLTNEDLTGFDPWIMPKNYAGFDMKMASTSSIERFIYTSLKEGYWDHANHGPSNWQEEIQVDHLYTYYKTWCDREDQVVLTNELLGKRLKDVFSEMKKGRPWNDGPRPRVYQFPSLSACRDAFERFFKQSPAIWD